MKSGSRSEADFMRTSRNRRELTQKQTSARSSAASGSPNMLKVGRRTRVHAVRSGFVVPDEPGPWPVGFGADTTSIAIDFVVSRDAWSASVTCSVTERSS